MHMYCTVILFYLNVIYMRRGDAKYSQLSPLNCAFATMWLYSYNHIVISESYDGHKLHDY